MMVETVSVPGALADLNPRAASQEQTSLAFCVLWLGLKRPEQSHYDRIGRVISTAGASANGTAWGLLILSLIQAS